MLLLTAPLGCCLTASRPMPTLQFFSMVSTLMSQEGSQQGDPLGPLLFCHTIHPLLMALGSVLLQAGIYQFTGCPYFAQGFFQCAKGAAFVALLAVS